MKMKEKKFELGPIQKSWIEALRKYPERQVNGTLGFKSGDQIKLCCLGQALLCFHEVNGTIPSWNSKEFLLDIDGDDRHYLYESYDKIGLKSFGGEINHQVNNPSWSIIPYYSLAMANDNHVSWATIADFLEKYPELVFDKSV